MTPMPIIAPAAALVAPMATRVLPWRAGEAPPHPVAPAPARPGVIAPTPVAPVIPAPVVVVVAVAVPVLLYRPGDTGTTVSGLGLAFDGVEVPVVGHGDDRQPGGVLVDGEMD